MFCNNNDANSQQPKIIMMLTTSKPQDNMFLSYFIQQLLPLPIIIILKGGAAVALSLPVIMLFCSNMIFMMKIRIITTSNIEATTLIQVLIKCHPI